MWLASWRAASSGEFFLLAFKMVSRFEVSAFVTKQIKAKFMFTSRTLNADCDRTFSRSNQGCLCSIFLFHNSRSSGSNQVASQSGITHPLQRVGSCFLFASPIRCDLLQPHTVQPQCHAHALLIQPAGVLVTKDTYFKMSTVTGRVIYRLTENGLNAPTYLLLAHILHYFYVCT